ncbi:MAG: hypothetical protein RIS64_4173 [Bacteroidota bacterium]|jgi:hypothetical protein
MKDNGRISIEKYGLNRDDLIFARKSILLEIQIYINEFCYGNCSYSFDLVFFKSKNLIKKTNCDMSQRQ